MQSATPPRAPGSASGLHFTDSLPSDLGQAREDAIVREVLRGNVPDFMRKFVEVDASGKDATGNERKLKLYVSPDYLSVGDDEDFVRVPLNPLSAQLIADEFGCVLPTRKMVDLIWKASALKLSPHPMSPDAKMTTTRRFVEHNREVEKVRRAKFEELDLILGILVAGHKKDVVLTNRLLDALGKVLRKVAIYGWQYVTGKVIQGLNPTSHEDTYADYSHGIRLVAERCELEGSLIDIRHVMADPVLWPLLSDEGQMKIVAYPKRVFCGQCERTYLSTDAHPEEKCKMNTVSDVHDL
jgi:hypothetical protein